MYQVVQSTKWLTYWISMQTDWVFHRHMYPKYTSLIQSISMALCDETKPLNCGYNRRSIWQASIQFVCMQIHSKQLGLTWSKAGQIKCAIEVHCCIHYLSVHSQDFLGEMLSKVPDSPQLPCSWEESLVGYKIWWMITHNFAKCPGTKGVEAAPKGPRLCHPTLYRYW